MAGDNVAIVRRLYDAVARRDSEAVLAIYHPDLEWDHTRNEAVASLVGGKTTYHGLREWSRDWYEAWESVEADLIEVVDAGERVVVVLDYRGRGRASGIEVEFTRMAGVLTFSEGRVVRAAWFRTRDEALAAIGQPG